MSETDAKPDPQPHSTFDGAAAKKFGTAYSAWMDARAERAKRDDPGRFEDMAGDDEDRKTLDILHRLEEAEHKLITTPAELPFQLEQKFEVMESMISERERDGRPTDNRHMLMITSFKADLYRFRDRH